eukprot:12287403-Karenia_brevis.AAC.1
MAAEGVPDPPNSPLPSQYGDMDSQYGPNMYIHVLRSRLAIWAPNWKYLGVQNRRFWDHLGSKLGSLGAVSYTHLRAHETLSDL